MYTELSFLPSIYPLNVYKRNTRTRCEVCPKLTIKTPERRLTRCSCVSFVNFEHVNVAYFINEIRWFRIQFDIFRPNYLESFYCDSPYVSGKMKHGVLLVLVILRFAFSVSSFYDLGITNKTNHIKTASRCIIVFLFDARFYAP